MPKTATFRKLLKKYRVRAGLTQKALAQFTHYSAETICKIEAGKRQPPHRVAVLEKFAECLQIPPAERAYFYAAATGQLAQPAAGLAYPNNLPAPRTTLIGRNNDLTAVCALLRQPALRCLTLTGLGGVGKTQLGLQAARKLLSAFADGAFFVDLAAIRAAELIAPLILSALDLKPIQHQDPLPSLSAHLRDKEMLLLLDNLEQIEAAAPVLAELLVAAPKVKVLATSRLYLNLYGEQVFEVQPLPLPDPHQPLEPSVLAQSPAVKLFVERLQAVRSNFKLTAENAPAVVEICRRLDGLPIALELAAAWGKLFSPSAMLTRLQNRLNLLRRTAGGDLPARHQTLRATLDWSYTLLDPPQQKLFVRLAVFMGGGTLEAIEAVCVPDKDLGAQFVDTIYRLVKSNLLWAQELPDGTTRLGMLETVREYALERLTQQGEVAALELRHAEYYLSCLEDTPPADRANRLALEQDNIRAAIDRLLDRQAWERVMRFYAAVETSLFAHFHLTELRHWLETIHASAEYGPQPLAATWQAQGLKALRFMAELQGDFAGATRFGEAAVELCRRLDNKALLIISICNVGRLACRQNDYPKAQRLYQEMLDIYQALDKDLDDPIAFIRMGIFSLWAGRKEEAQTWLHEAVRLSRQSGNADALAHTLSQLGWVTRYLGHPQPARTYLEESLAIYETLDTILNQAGVLSDLGLVALDEGDLRQAEAQLLKSLKIYTERDSHDGLVFNIERLGFVAARQGRYERAARLWGAVEQLRPAYNLPRTPDQRADYERHMAASRAQITDDVWQAAWAAGGAWTLKQALAYALETNPRKNAAH